MSDEQLARIRALVAEQADDPSLWFIADDAPTAYVQAALRKLHEVIENETSEQVARRLLEDA